MSTVDLVLVESPKVMKLLTTTFSAKRRVMALVICRLRAEERRAKHRIGCPRDIKVRRKDLAAVSSHAHLGGDLKEVPVQGETLCQPRIKGHCYFRRMGI
jgi:hypothetical protein